MGRFRYVIPNLITCANIALGFLSIPLAAAGRFEVAVYLLVGAVLLDMCDGAAARKLKATSAFGQQMDSLCDAMSFCAAPALLAYWSVLHELGWTGLAVSLCYLIAGVLRLARFNVSSDVHSKESRSTGLPTPIGAGYLMAIALMRDHLPPFAAAAVVMLIAVVMISRFPFPGVKGRKAATYAIFVGLANYLAVVFWPNWYTVIWWNLWNVVIVLIAHFESPAPRKV
jgi:CDP-diacylglycerol---serine O-phosphatidyltransferase